MKLAGTLVMMVGLGWNIQTVIACEALDQESFAARLRKEKVQQLVFFASWCSSCKGHMNPAELSKSLYVAVFDEQEGAAKAAAALLGEAGLLRCVWDKDGSIAKIYGVKSLPAKRELPVGP